MPSMEEATARKTGMTLKDIFNKTYEIFGESIKDTLIQTAKDIPEVQEAIEEEKLKVGKNVTWQIMPFVIIGAVVIFLIARFK